MTIRMYEVEVSDNPTTCEIPEGAELLHVGLDPSHNVCIWFLVNEENPIVERSFKIIGTGHKIEDYNLKHLGSVLVKPFVWHVFEKGLPRRKGKQ